MTAESTGFSRHPDAPDVMVDSVIPAAAGIPATVPVQVHHRGRRPMRLRLSVLGLDSRWAPEPLELGVLQPGETASVTLRLLPERGSLGARYPFTVAAEAMATDGSGRPVIGVAESVLAVDSAERITVAIHPASAHAVFRRRIRVDITNPSGRHRTFSLVPDAAAGASLRLRRGTVDLPPQRTVSVKGTVRIKRPTIMGGENVHAVAIAAQGTGAPEYAEATVRSKPMIGHTMRAVVGLVLVVALWATLAIVFIPKISDRFRPGDEATGPTPTTQAAGGNGTNEPESAGQGGSGNGANKGQGSGSGSGNDPGATDGGSSGSDAGGSDSSGGSGGSDGSGGSGGSGGPGGAGGSGDGTGDGTGGNAGSPQTYQLSGTVTASGVTDPLPVKLAPVSLGGAGNDGSLPPAQSPDTAREVSAFRGNGSDAIGKLVGPIVRAVPGRAATLTTHTDKGGAFTFSAVPAPGYYLLTVSAEGFQAQRFLINSDDLVSTTPLQITLVPGKGSLAGTVTGPDGQPVGAAEIVVTDGQVTLQTSSVSPSSDSGQPGSWSIGQVSTPGTYLVTAHAPGFGSASQLIDLDASGSADVHLTLTRGEGTITGTVTSEIAPGGLGGATVTATGEGTTRTATTVTSAAMRGAFVLPNLPVPGQYTVTITSDGYLTQTQRVTLAENVGSASVTATLSRADAVVAGTVTGLTRSGSPQGGLGGVGLSLASNEVTLKTMTTSGDSAGSFQFTGVTPGTYVLTATQFGRTPASATVELKASDTRTVDLTLAADAGAELPATSHIRGQITDSRTGGYPTCDRAVAPVPEADCAATVTVSAPKDPADPSAGTVTYTAHTGKGQNFIYTIPPVDGRSSDGLTPGLYTVRISAPGYEPTVTHVQVGLGQTTPAPLSSLPALGIIGGTITSRMGSPSAPNCVIAVPASVDLSGRLPGSCTADPNGHTCTVGTLGSQPCGLTSMGGKDKQPFGTYQVRGLTHGRYQMLIIPQDRDYTYVVGDPPIVTVDLGSDGQFFATLDRYGNIDAKVYVIDRSTGDLQAAAGATLSITARGESRRPPADGTVTADDHGLATLTGLNGDYTVTARVGHMTATHAVTGITLNATVPLTLVVTGAATPVIGKVVTDSGDSVGGSSSVPVQGAAVTVTGTVGFIGTTAVSGSASLVTDPHGCYAIIPAGMTTPEAADLATADCPLGISDPNAITVMTSAADGSPGTLRTDQVRVSVAANAGGTLPHVPSDELITGSGATRSIPPITVAPVPVPVGSLTLRVTGPTTGYRVPNLGAAVIDSTGKPALAGSVKLQATAGAAQWWIPSVNGPAPGSPLRFSDSSLFSGGANPTAMPGRYTFRVALPHFGSVTVDLICELGSTTGCYFVPEGNPPLPPGTVNPGGREIVLRQAPNISVDITLGSRTPDWSTATVTQTGGPSLGTVGIGGKALSGYLTFDGDRSRIADAGATYHFTMLVPGYHPFATTVRCGADYTATARPCTATARPTSLPAFGGGSLALSATASPYGDKSFSPVDVIHSVISDNGATVTARIDAHGAVTLHDSNPAVLPGQLMPGTYTVRYSLSGFVSATATVDCTSGGSCAQVPATVTLQMLPEATGMVTLPLAPGSSTVDLADATVTVDAPHRPSLSVTLASPPTVQVDADGSPVTATVSMTWRDSALDFAGVVLKKKYTATIDVPGYRPATVHCDATGGACDASVTLTLDPHPAMTLTILPASSIDTAQLLVDGGAPGVTLASDVHGNLTWHQGSAQAGLVTPRAAPYTITAQLPGYQMAVGGVAVTSVDFSCTSETHCTFPDIVLTKRTALTVSVVDGNGDPITSATRVTVTHAGSTTNSPITVSGSATFTNQSTVAWDGTATPPSDISYSIGIRVAGYTFLSGLDKDSSGSRIQCASGADTADGVHLFPGGTTTCTVTITDADRLASITGSVVRDTTPLAGGVHIGTQNVPDLTVTAGHDGDTVAAQTGDNGELTLTGVVTGADGSADVEGLKDGTWTLSVTQAGYYDFSGTVTITGGVVTAASPAGDPATTSDSTGGWIDLAPTGDVTLHLKPKPVTLTVALDNGARAVLGGATVTVTENGPSTPGHLDCDTTASPTPDCVVTDGTDQYIRFTGVWPGSYAFDVTFTSGKYSTLTMVRAVDPQADGTATVTFALTKHVSTITQTVVQDGRAVVGATVRLCVWQDTTCSTAAANAATDFDGTTFDDQQTDSDGAFRFDNVTDGLYSLWVTAPGYQPQMSTSILVQFPGVVVTPTISLRPETGTVSLTLTAPSGTGVDWTSATVTLTQTDHDGRVESDAPIENIAVDASGTATATQVPTGTWEASVTGVADAPFGTPVASTDAEVTVAGGTNSQDIALAIRSVTLTANWRSTQCTSGPGSNRDAGDVTLTVSDGTDSHDLPRSVGTTAGITSATATALLPTSGNFTWKPALPASGWSGVFDAVGSQSTSNTTMTLDPTAAPLTATISVDGTSTTAYGLTASASGEDDVALSASTASCVAVGKKWVVGIDHHAEFGSIATSPATMPAAGASAAVSGHTLTPTVELQAVTGRPNDSRDVTVEVFEGTSATGTSVWSVSDAPVSGNAPYVGTTLVLPNKHYSVAASPPSEDAFDTAKDENIDITATHASTLTLPYARAWATATVKDANDAAVGGATVTIGTVSATTGSDGTVALYDVDPGATTVTAHKGSATSGDVTISLSAGVAANALGDITIS